MKLTTDITEYKNKLRQYVTKYQKINSVYFQSSQILNYIIKLEHFEITKLDLNFLGIQEDEFQNYLLNYINDEVAFNNVVQDLIDVDTNLRGFREVVQKNFGVWAIIDSDFINHFSKSLKNRRVLEIMAGNGMLSSALSKQSVNIIATDNNSWNIDGITNVRTWTNDIIQKDALTAVSEFEFDDLIMAWSPDNELIDWQILQYLREQKPKTNFWCIGEINGATNSFKFWQEAKFSHSRQLTSLQNSYPNFDILNDNIYLIK